MNDEQSPKDTASPISSMMESLLSNPEMLQKLSGLMGAMTAQTSDKEEREISPAQSNEESIQTSVSPNLAGDGLASLLSDPSFIEKLPQMISVMKPLLSSMPPPPKKGLHKGSPQECRDNLLLALKPFLSPERCDAVDLIIRISHLGSVFNQLK